MRRTELIAAASLVVLGLVALFVIVPRAVVESPASSGLSPSFMPYVAAALITAAALGWLTNALRGAGADSAPVRGHWHFIAASAAVLGISLLLMATLGYLVGGGALVAGTLALARAKLATIVVTAVVAPLLLWLLFGHLLATPLP